MSRPVIRFGLLLFLSSSHLLGQAPVHLAVSQDTGLATFLATPPGRLLPVDAPASAGAEQRARAFLASRGAAFGVRSQEQVRARRIHERDEVGMDHVRFEQVHEGVPVTGGGITVHLRGTGVVAVNAEILPGLEGFDTRPSIHPPEAVAVTRALLARHLGASEAQLSVPRLEILNRGLLEGGRRPTRLAWFVEASGPSLREFVWIDAQTGAVLLRFSQLADALDRKVYNGASTSALPGTLVRIEGGPSTGDTDADLAYQYAGDTWSYYWTAHGRDSFDGTGATIVSTVHHCPAGGPCPYANAFWNGSQMVYGNGFPAADDVVAHELTHAVTERTAGLFYYMQSGALNESFSDIFGETVDLTNTGGNDASGVRWQMGEDVPGSGAVRNLLDPTLFGDPGKLSDGQFWCSAADNGGVHTNSGVPNHAFALMVDGGTYNGVTVAGIGLSKAGKIQYRALTEYLLSGSGFLDADSALRQSCADLTGTAGITAADCAEVGKTLDAVELADPWPCPAGQTQPQEPALCPAGQVPVDLFFDDFEAGAGNWLTSTPTGPNLWFLGDFFAHSGTQHLWGENKGTTADSRASLSLDVAVPAGGARLQLDHAFDFESSGSTYFDGGVVEVSTNAGASWSDAGGLITAGKGYGGTIFSGDTNPLKGRSAFVASSYGYTASQLDLSGFAGQSVRVRFRLGTDSIVNDLGWVIDDVRIYRCQVPCSYAIAPTSASFGAGGGSGSVGVTAPGGCAWTAMSHDAWIAITSGTTGSGNGTVAYSVAANSGASSRTGTLTVAGQTFPVNQAANGAAPDAWTPKAPLPAVRSSLGAAELGGLVYAVGGGLHSGDATVTAYDPATNTWTLRASMSMGRSGLGVAAVGGEIYALSGWDGNNMLVNTPTVEAYDPDTNAWSPRASMLTGRRAFAVAVANGKIYAFGGCDAACNALAAVEEYDPATDVWTARAPLPTPRRGAAAATVNGKIYVIGGCPGGCTSLSTVEEYDPATNTWTARAPMPTPRSFLSAVALSGRIYAIGGFTGTNGTSLATVEVYDPATDSWSSAAPLITPRRLFGAAAASSRIYAIGGLTGSGLTQLASVEQYTPYPTLEIGGATVSEGNSGSKAAMFPVTLSEASSATVTVQAATANGTATAGQDYDAASATLSFPPGTTTQTFVVTVRGDATVEPNETFSVALSSPIQALLGEVRTGAGLILNDDVDCTSTLSPSGQTFGAAGGPSNVQVQIPATCAWTAASNDSWITVTGGTSGTGPGLVRYTVDPNPGSSARSGSLTIAGQTFPVTQTANGIAADVWTPKEPLSAVRSSLGAAELGGLVYAVGGGLHSGDSTVAAYDPATDTWTARASMSMGRSGLGVAAVGGEIYALSGWDGNAMLVNSPTVEAYDPATNAWSPRASMLTGRRAFAVAVANGKIYAFGGCDAACNALSAVEEYDPATDAWTARAPLPTPRRGAAAATVNGKIYVLGGCPGGCTSLSTVEEYDPATNTWTARAPMPTPRSFLSAVALGGRIYALGGLTGTNGTALSTVEVYDPATDSWASAAPLITPRRSFGAAVAGGRIYAIGGLTGSGLTQLASVEEYTPYPTLAVLSTSPAPNAADVAPAAELSATFDQLLDPDTVTVDTFRIRGLRSGLATSNSLSYDETTKTLHFPPDQGFEAGEPVTATLTSGLRSSPGASLEDGFTWSFYVAAAEGTGTFAASTSEEVGIRPSCFVVNDFNADGNPDLAVKNMFSNSFSIFLGAGDGTLTSGPAASPGGYTEACAGDDFNNDGHLDLVASGTEGIWLLLGNGDGTFTTGGGFSTPSDIHQAMTAGDFDGDGNPDVAVTNRNSHSVSVALGNGDGTFGSVFVHAVGNESYGIAAGDFDEDGRLDLATVNHPGASLSILRNDGGGAFTALPEVAVGGSPYSVHSADLNSDGHLDLVVDRGIFDDVALFPGLGTGSFGPPSSLPFRVTGDTGYLITVGDLNADGHLDLAGVHVNNNLVSVAPGDGAGSFGPVGEIALDAPDTIAFGDFNKDGALDLVVANDRDRVPDPPSPSTVSLLLNLTCAEALALSPTAQSFSPAGGSGSVAVTAPGGCAWSATSDATWLTVTSGGSGSGDGTVGFSVAANESSLPRTGTITVVGHTLTVIQEGVPCTWSVQPASLSLPAGGGAGDIVVTAPAGCAWTAASNAPWIGITGTGGSGNGVVHYAVGANTAVFPRTGTLTVAGQTVPVVQDSAGLDFYTVIPCRLADTRTTSPLVSNVPRTFPVTGLCGIPASAKAIALNVAAVSPSNNGHLVLYPGGTAMPGTSTLNFVAGRDRANNAIVALAPDGSGTLDARAVISGGGQVHLLIDVSGYFE